MRIAVSDFRAAVDFRLYSKKTLAAPFSAKSFIKRWGLIRFDFAMLVTEKDCTNSEWDPSLGARKSKFAHLKKFLRTHNDCFALIA